MKILVVEGEIPVAMMMVSALSQAGCEVSVATTGRKGMELAQEQKFDLVILDVILPDMEGFKLCFELKQRHASRHAVVIFISAHPCKAERQRGLELGAVDYIPKPFEVGNFTSCILSHTEEDARHETATTKKS